MASPQSSGPFYLVLLFLLLEYGRPQESIPGLAALRLPAVVTIFITLSLIFSATVSLSDKQTKLFLIMLSLMAFHIPIALNTYWAVELTKTMLTYFVIYLGIINFIDSFEKFKTLVTAWIAVHIYLACNGILKGGMGIGGFLGDQNDFALTINMIIPFVFFLSLAELRRILIYVGSLFLFLFTNMLTFSRGGFVGMVAVGIYCWLRVPGAKKILSTIIIGLMVLFTFSYATDEFWDRVKSIQEAAEPGGTGEDRMYQWKIGWAMFLDHPIIGVGQGNFPWNFREYEVAAGYDEGLHGRSRAGRAAHSLYFTLIPELGLVGIFIFLGILSYVYKDLRIIHQSARKGLWKESGNDSNIIVALSYAMTGSLIGFLVSGTFVSVLYYPHFWLLTAFVIALKKVTYKNDEKSAPSY